MGAETLLEVIQARQYHKNDKYLLQETIKPSMLAGRRAWFRVFYAFGDIIPSWWDDTTHIYCLLQAEDEYQLGLEPLSRITEKIHTICKLDFFSTEIVLTTNKKFVVVDYVNEMCDMRIQSQHADGVPDTIVDRIIAKMTDFIKQY